MQKARLSVIITTAATAAAANINVATIATTTNTITIKTTAMATTPIFDDTHGYYYDTDCDDGDAAMNWDDFDGDGVSSCAGDCVDTSSFMNVNDVDGDGYGDNPGGYEADDCPTVAGASNVGLFGCQTLLTVNHLTQKLAFKILCHFRPK